MKTAALLIGFGGPTQPGEVRPFLKSVLKGIPVPQERFNEVLSHYEVIGGRSPYKEVVASQKRGLEAWFREKKIDLPVFAAFRHSTPSFEDTLVAMKGAGIERVLGFVLSPFRSYPSFGKYEEKMSHAQDGTGTQHLKIEYTEPFHKDPLFIMAQSKKIEETLLEAGPDAEEKTYTLFTAHSIPLPLSEESGYADQFAESASLTAKYLHLKFWDLAYQSRSGRPEDPWLGPDISEVIPKINPGLFKHIVAVPVGFLNENAEVTYDLDVAARRAAEERGFIFHRASTASDSPQILELMGRQLLRKLKGY